ncbi:MAG: SDR family NAD(P)-dependent oxidoreductase [Promethearchaeota archaeon]
MSDIDEKQKYPIILHINGGEAIIIRAEVSIEENVKLIINETIKSYDRIDMLFNNAGIVEGGAIDTTTTENWDRTMVVNVRGISLISKYAIHFYI